VKISLTRKQNSPGLKNQSLEQRYPKEYLHADGWERKLPLVKNLTAILKTRPRKIPSSDAVQRLPTFVIIGAGGSGKTESLKTALHIVQKTNQVFDLVKTTFETLQDQKKIDSVMRALSSQPEKKAIADELFTFLDGWRAIIGGIHGEDLWKKFREVYDGKDPIADPFLIKRVEHTLITFYKDQITEELQRTNDAVIFIDEFDFSIKSLLSAVEIATAKEVLGIARQLRGKQIGIIVHPSASENDEFMRALASVFPRLTKIEIEYIPRRIEQKILATIDIKGNVARALMHEMGGIPAAYLSIMTNEEGKKDSYIAERDPLKQVEKIRSDVINRLIHLKVNNVDKADLEVQQALYALAIGKELNIVNPRTDTGKELIVRMLRTIFVKKGHFGHPFMVPIACQVLAKYIDQAYLKISIGKQATSYSKELRALVDEIEQCQEPLRDQINAVKRMLEREGNGNVAGVNKGLRDNLIEKRDQGSEKALHMTIMSPLEACTLKNSATFFQLSCKLSDFLQNLKITNDIEGIGWLRSDTGDGENTGDKLACFMTFKPDSELYRALLGFRKEVGLKNAGEFHPHVTLGYINGDVFESDKKEGEFRKITDPGLTSSVKPRLDALIDKMQAETPILNVPDFEAYWRQVGAPECWRKNPRKKIAENCK